MRARLAWAWSPGSQLRASVVPKRRLVERRAADFDLAVSRLCDVLLAERPYPRPRETRSISARTIRSTMLGRLSSSQALSIGLSTRKNTDSSRVGHQTLIRMLRRNLGIELKPGSAHEKRARAKFLDQYIKIDARRDLTRDDKIRAKRLAGMTIEELSREYGISRPRVIQITCAQSEDCRPAREEDLVSWVRTQKDIKEVLWRAQVDHELGETQADNRYGADLLLEERRVMMLRYEKYIDNPPADKQRGTNVVPFGNKRTA
jgi:hypothetical protein